MHWKIQPRYFKHESKRHKNSAKFGRLLFDWTKRHKSVRGYGTKEWFTQKFAHQFGVQAIRSTHW